jgi:hypothetical protein
LGLWVYSLLWGFCIQVGFVGSWVSLVGRFPGTLRPAGQVVASQKYHEKLSGFWGLFGVIRGRFHGTLATCGTGRSVPKVTRKAKAPTPPDDQ